MRLSFPMFFSLKISAANIDFQGPEHFVRKETYGPLTYLLVGRVYGEGQTDLPSLAQKLETQFLKGRYLLLKVDLGKSHIDFWTDKYRLLNPVFAKKKDYIWIGNTSPEKGERDLLSEESLVKLGAVIYPQTLFKEGSFITGNGSYRSALQMSDHALTWPTQETEIQPQVLAEIFKESLRELIQEWKPHYFRVSGGVDSRMIALSLPQDLRSTLQAQVLCHPQLSPQEDRDVLGAQAITNSLNIPLKVLTPGKEDYNYLGGLLGSDILSGLYGGEFLGGVMHRHTPVHDETLEVLPESELKKLWQKRLKALGSRRLQTEMFLSAFRATIYNSTRYSWASPWQLNQYCKSPFVEQKFIDALLAIPYDQLRDYKLYGQIYKIVADEYHSIPLSSPLIHFSENFSGFKQGREPKDIEMGEPPHPDELGALNLKSYNIDQW